MDSESPTARGGPPPEGAGEARRPHIVLVIPRGEAARNFLYSETLGALHQQARITVLSVVDDPAFSARFEDKTERFLPLREFPSNPLVSRIRTLTENAHDRWLWSEVAKNNWELRDRRAAEQGIRIRRHLTKALARVLGNRPTLRALTRFEQVLSYRLRPTDDFGRLFEEIRPDLVFNGSHIHGLAGELPLRVAHAMGIPTAGFIFSWDNLTSRSRIFVPYDHYLVWHDAMKKQLLEIYPEVGESHVHVTGTPQFDFHLRGDLEVSREELCQQIGIDPARPYVLYTTGISNHFYEEHLHVEAVIRHLQELDLDPAPQLVVRTYVKGTSPEMTALSKRQIPGVVFPPVLWEPKWQTPLFEDLEIYSNLLRHAAVGINAASTVSLELLLFDKPVINLDFDPTGSELPWCMGYSRHIHFDHYYPVAQSGAVMVAASDEDMGAMLHRGLTNPGELREERERFLSRTFGPTLDGGSGRRVAQTLLALAQGQTSPAEDAGSRSPA